jgi:hypothetical protein
MYNLASTSISAKHNGYKMPTVCPRLEGWDL